MKNLIPVLIPLVAATVAFYSLWVGLVSPKGRLAGWKRAALLSGYLVPGCLFLVLDSRLVFRIMWALGEEEETGALSEALVLLAALLSLLLFVVLPALSRAGRLQSQGDWWWTAAVIVGTVVYVVWGVDGGHSIVAAVALLAAALFLLPRRRWQSSRSPVGCP